MSEKALKIALIMPPSITHQYEVMPVVCSYAGWGLIQVAGYLSRHGNDVQILDLSNCDITEGLETYGYGDFDVYGISMYTESALGVDLLCRVIRETNPKAKIIVGGHHATHEWKYVLAEYPLLYAVVVGDGEVPMMRLVKGITDGSYTRDYPGVAYKSQTGDYVFNGKYTNKDLHDVELELEWLKKEYVCFPLLDYAKRLYPQHPRLLKQYLERNRYYEGCKAAGIITSRGCRSKCSFCTFEISGGYYMHRPEYICDLLDWFASNGISNLVFYDSTFLADLGHAEEICRTMIKNRYNFRWTAQTQVHHEDRSIIKLMSQAGLVQMNLGLESGSPAIVRDMNKKFDVREFPEIVNAYDRFGVGVCANLIIGSPGENNRTISETCRIFYNVDKDAIGEIQDLKLYPASNWFLKAVNEGRITREWDWKTRGVPRFIFHDDNEIERWRITIEAHFRYASFFEGINKRVDNIALLGFPEDANSAILQEALGFAFDGCPISQRLKSGSANLIIIFSDEYPEVFNVKSSEKDQLVWCSLSDGAFMLKKIVSRSVQ